MSIDNNMRSTLKKLFFENHEYDTEYNEWWANTAEELLRNIVLNAELAPDPSMQGTTDVFLIPIDDVALAADHLGMELKVRKIKDYDRLEKLYARIKNEY